MPIAAPDPRPRDTGHVAGAGLVAKPTTGAVLMVGSAAAWAAGLMSSKAVLNATKASPVTLLTVQLGSSVGVLAIMVRLRRLPVRAALRQGWPGLLEPGLAYQLSLAGLALTSAANATVLASLEPVAIPLLCFALFRQRPRPVQLAAATAATVGAIVVSWDGAGGRANATGDLLVAGSVIAAAAYVVFSERHVAHHHPVVLAFTQQLWALALTAAVLLATASFETLTWPNTALHLFAAGASGLCNYGLPFVLYLAALRHLPLATAAIYLCLIPVFGLVGAIAFLSEHVTPLQIIGSVVVTATLLGLAVLERSQSASIAG